MYHCYPITRRLARTAHDVFTTLGNENFFFLVLPLLYWSVDTGLALRVAFILATGNYLYSMIKLLFVALRPYWVSAIVFIKFWHPVAGWLKTKTLARQIMIAFLISLLMIIVGVLTTTRLDGYVFPVEWQKNARRAGPLPEPVSMAGVFTSAGSLFGLAAGAAWIASEADFKPQDQ